MVIYGEYLFVENFITGGMILHLTGTLSGAKAGKARIILGSALCGIYGFILFVPLEMWLSLAAKLGFSLAVILFVFGPMERRYFGRLVLLFYFISFAMGGITIGLMYFFEVTGISVNGTVYMGGAGYAMIACFIAGAYILLALIVSWMRSFFSESRTVRRVVVGLGGRTAELLGLLDTGNFLQNPATGKPVILLSAEAVYRLFPPEIAETIRREKEPRKALLALSDTGLAGRLSLIPYCGVGVERGLLLGIRADFIELAEEEQKRSRALKGVNVRRIERERERMNDVTMGIYHGVFGKGFADEPYSVLLHPEFMRGGMICHG